VRSRPIGTRWSALAARGPEYFADPHELVIDRKIPMNPTFGYGPHRCIGSHLARLQAHTTMEETVRRLPDIRLPAGQGPTFFHSTVTRDMLTLPVEFTAGAKEGDGS
jgi:cytochrome P450